MGAHSDPESEHRENKSQASQALLHHPQLLLAGVECQEGFLPSSLWWTDPGWMPGAHQPAVSLLSVS